MKPVSAAQMRDIEKRALSEFGIPGTVLMENAGRGAAEVIHRDSPGARILIFCGKGNNGGDGFVAARYLHDLGHRVEICLLAQPQELKGDSLLNFKVLSQSAIPVNVASLDTLALIIPQLIENNDVMVDSIFGTGLNQPIKGTALTIIEMINRSGKKVFSLDIPSGLHPDTGQTLGISVTAYATITFGAPKVGFSSNPGSAAVGQVFVVDIGLPESLFSDLR